MLFKIDNVEVGDEEIVGEETRERRLRVSMLRDYLLREGFKYEGMWYFIKTFMNPVYFNFLSSAGLAERVGTLNDLRKMGVEIPDNFYNDQGRPQVYRITDSRINSLAPRQE